MDLNKKFPKKRILITGAGSGLGKALAYEFAKKEWKIAILDINKDRIKEIEEMIVKCNSTALPINCNVAKQNEWNKAFKKIIKEWGGIDILVNNAGISAAGDFEKITIKNWEEIFEINLKSVIYGCRTFIPVFKEQKSGYIVNIASYAAIASLPEMANYNITKTGVVSLSETLKIELSPYNTGVSVICPTFFKTNLMDKFNSTDPKQKEIAEKLFNRSKISSKEIAVSIIKAISKGKFYVVMRGEGKFFWYFKRAFPETYFKILAYLYKRNIFEKVFGIKK